MKRVVARGLEHKPAKSENEWREGVYFEESGLVCFGQAVAGEPQGGWNFAESYPASWFEMKEVGLSREERERLHAETTEALKDYSPRDDY